jgi:Ca-activated chloride channel family protein
MTFRWQYALCLLLVLPVLLRAYVVSLRRKHEALRRAGMSPTDENKTLVARIRAHAPALLFTAGLAALLVSIARPVVVTTLPAREGTVVLLIDVSLSMAATDVPPTRLDAARAAAIEFVKAQAQGIRIGIVAFGGHADVVQLPTTNRTAVLTALNHLELQRFTAIGNGLMGALLTLVPTIDIGGEYDIWGTGRTPVEDQGSTFRAIDTRTGKPQKAIAPGSRLSSAVILISDGRGTMGVPPQKAAKLAANLGIRVYTIGVGTLYGGVANVEGWPPIHADFDEEILKDIASVTHGEYFLARTADKVTRIYDKLVTRVVFEKTEIEITAIMTALGVLLTLASAALSLVSTTVGRVKGA